MIFSGAVVRNLLDVHAACRTGDEGDTRGRTVDQRRQVKLALYVHAFADVDAIDGAPIRPGLGGDERAAQHLLGERLHLGARLGEAHAALLARRSLLELALAATAGVDLRLHHEQRAG